MIYNYVQRGRKIEQTSVYNVICATVQFTGSSAMAEGSRDALVCIEKSLQPWMTLIYTVAAIMWPYGISLPVCGLGLGLALRSQFETRSVGPRSTIEDSFLVIGCSRTFYRGIAAVGHHAIASFSSLPHLMLAPFHFHQRRRVTHFSRLSLSLCLSIYLSISCFQRYRPTT